MSGLSTLCAMPSATFAGDTFLVEIPGTKFAAPEWSMEYHFRAPSGGIAIDITSTDSASSHLFSVAATETATWPAADYYGTGIAIGPNAEVVTHWRGMMEVRDQLSGKPDTFDQRSWAQQCLDKIEAVILGRAGSAVLNSTIAGQTLGRLTPEQLFAMRDKFKAEVLNEQAVLDAEAGKPSKRVFGITFPLP